jgi:hypothetical protein
MAKTLPLVINNPVCDDQGPAKDFVIVFEILIEVDVVVMASVRIAPVLNPSNPALGVAIQTA